MIRGNVNEQGKMKEKKSEGKRRSIPGGKREESDVRMREKQARGPQRKREILRALWDAVRGQTSALVTHPIK